MNGCQTSQSTMARANLRPKFLSTFRSLVRGIQLLGLLLLHGIPTTISVASVALIRGRNAAYRRLYRDAVQLIQRLGPTFVKFGQILSCRRDVLPPVFCDALAVLHDAVDPMTEGETRLALAHAYGAGPDARFHFEDLALIASGSIASVFRAVSKDGALIALKVRRPGIERIMIDDLSLLKRMVRLAERLQKCKGMPLGDLVAYVSTAILGQLDLAQETINLACLHRSLAAFPEIRVPAPVVEASGFGCLAMDFIPGLDAKTIGTLSPNQRVRLANIALMAVQHLMFVDGFTHCDLHPGNLYATAAGKLVILDAGFAVRLSDRVRLLIGEFFYSLATGNGTRCAQVVIESAQNISPTTDIRGFVTAVATLVQRASRRLSMFSMMAFGNEIFDLQQEFGLYAQSDFAFPMMALAVLEGTIRQISPDVDFSQLGRMSDSLSELSAN
jgi:ubiquinone biosynthesis protein